MTKMLMDAIRQVNKQSKTILERFMSKYIFKIQVTDIDVDDNKTLISGVALVNSREFSDIKLSGINIGNGRGIISFPKIGDICLVLNLFGEYIYLASIYDEVTRIPDNQVVINKESMIFINKSYGSYIHFNDSDDIIITTKTGAKVKLLKDGTFKLFDKNNYGIQSDGNGNVTIYGDLTIHGDVSDLEAGGDGVTSNNSKTSGTF